MTSWSVEQRVAIAKNGPIRRMVSPQDLGARLKPFVFLDYLKAEIQPGFGFGFHPHSGIATLTYQLDCDVEYEDTTGQVGTVKRGGLEWMLSGGGVWHRGTLTGSSKVTGFQLWVALPPGVEDGPSEGQYVPPEAVPQVEGVRVLLGRHGGVASPIRLPSPMIYLHVVLPPGERWHAELPASFDVAWVMPFEGAIELNGETVANELAVLRPAASKLALDSMGGAQFMFGAAVHHPFQLVLGNHSVHTNGASLLASEARIRNIGEDLDRRGRR